MNATLTLWLAWLDKLMQRLQALHVLLLYGLLVLLFGAVGVIGFTALAGSAVDKEHARLDSIAALQVQEIEGWFNEQVADVASLASNPVFRELLTPIRLRHTGQWSDRLKAWADAQRVTGWLQQAMHSHVYRSVEIVSANGESLMAVGTAPYGRAEVLPLLSRALNLATAAYSDVQVSPDGQRYVLFGGRVPDVPGLDPVALVFAINITDQLLPSLERWPNTTRSGDLLLFRHDKGRISLLNKPLADTGAFQTLRDDNPNSPSAQAMR